MADSTTWWLLAGMAVAIELIIGTFYLLMLSLGMVAGALAAHLGAGMATQLVVAAVVGGGSVLAWHVVRVRRAAGAEGQPNANFNLDAGELVRIDHWSPDNTAAVRYRGTSWTAVPFDGVPQGPGFYRVREVSGTRLIVEKD